MAQKHVFLSPSNQNANIGVGSYGTEQNRMVELCNILGPILERCGFRVSRQDSLTPIGGRTAWANSNGVDFYMAVHSNAGGGSGATMGYWTPGAATNIAAETIKKYLDASMPLKKNPCARWSFGEILSPNMVSPYCETIFHDNKTDVDWYLSGNNKTLVAQALAKGICEHMGVAYVGDTPSPPPETTIPADMIFRVFASAWAGYDCLQALAYAAGKGTKSYIALCADSKYRVYTLQLETASVSVAFAKTGPDSVVRLEAINASATDTTGDKDAQIAALKAQNTAYRVALDTIIGVAQDVAT